MTSETITPQSHGHLTSTAHDSCQPHGSHVLCFSLNIINTQPTLYKEKSGPLPQVMQVQSKSLCVQTNYIKTTFFLRSIDSRKPNKENNRLIRIMATRNYNWHTIGKPFVSLRKLPTKTVQDLCLISNLFYPHIPLTYN